MLLLSCSRNKDSEKEVILTDYEWIDKDFLSIVSFDRFYLKKDNNYSRYFLLQDSLLGVEVCFPGSDSTEVFKHIELYWIDHIDEDSLVLSGFDSRFEPVSNYHAAYYSKKLIYKPSIKLNSIIIKFSHPNSAYVDQAFLLSKDSILIRADVLMPANEAGTRENKIADLCTNPDDSIFDSIQNLVRYTDIKNIDDIFRQNPIGQRGKWEISIFYNDTVKKCNIASLPYSLEKIWNTFFSLVNEAELKETGDIYEFGPK
ncbi:MAG: hypothetical protein C0596_11365 [Marinilabiliales bacterium]|nr:MAG: hypothetical protein C0596_11365 [Marinilabiliales bacterium]